MAVSVRFAAAVAVVLRRTPEQRLRRLLDTATEAMQQAWARRWPRIETALLRAPDIGADAALAAAARVQAGWWSVDDHGTVVEGLARSYANGQAPVLAQAPRRVCQIDYPPDIPGLDATNIFATEIDVAMSVADEAAADWLARDSMFWIDGAWDHALGQQIAGVVHSVLEAPDQASAGTRLAEALGTRFAKPESYWDLVGRAALVRARSFGAVSGMEHVGVETYRWVSFLDERTSEQCRILDDTVFSIGAATRTRDSVIAATSPDDMKQAHPWVTPTQIRDKSVKSLADLGVTLPPIHGNCRSVVVAETFGDFEVPA